MRKIVVLNRLSLDGYFAGPNGEIDWMLNDPEVDRAAHELMRPDTLLLGRVTYQMFFGYWPQVARDPGAPAGARKLAGELAQMNKIVFSRALPEVTWENSRLVQSGAVEEVSRLKSGNGADITIFGSGTIVQQLARERLIDEYLIVATPVILGAGKPMFEDVQRSRLELLEARSYPSGNVLLHYRSAAS